MTEIQARCEVQYVPQCYNKKLANSLDRQTIQSYLQLLFVEFNTIMALTILTELRDFVGAGVGQSRVCETAQGDQRWDYGLLVLRRVVGQTA